MIRSFLAVEISDVLKQEALAFVNQVRKHLDRFRFVDPANWHLTLHFFGAINEQAIERVKSKLAPALIRVAPFSVSLEGNGAFPLGRYPRVLWVGIGQGSDKLVEMKSVVDQVLKDLKFPVEKRPYSPHLTVARAKTRPTKEIQTTDLTGVWGGPFKGRAKCRISEVTLFRSELSPQGARYSVLHKFLLSP